MGACNYQSLWAWKHGVGKHSFASHTKQTAKAIKGSTSFMRNNIPPWILEKIIENVPLCSDH